MTNNQEPSTSTIVQNDHLKASSQETFSPRQVAKSIGVSESSLKRWCDSGHLFAIKTAGGHRRIPRSAVISFVKKRKLKLLNPENLGLPTLDDIAIRDPADAANQFYDALLVPNALQCRKLLVFMFIEGWDVAEIVDLVISPAFVRIGDEWCNGNVEVFEERQACTACNDAIHELSRVVPSPEPRALTAIGGSIESDHYDIPTLALEVTLNSLGWHATSLGRNLPLETMAKAARQHQPDLLWVSISHLEQPELLVEALHRFSNEIPADTTLVIGGRAINSDLRSQIKNAICCDNFSQLAALVRKIRQTRETSAAPESDRN